MKIFRRLRAAAIISVIVLFVMAIVDMFFGTDWVEDLLTPLVMGSVFGVAYMFAPRISKVFGDDFSQDSK